LEEEIYGRLDANSKRRGAQGTVGKVKFHTSLQTRTMEHKPPFLGEEGLYERTEEGMFEGLSVRDDREMAWWGSCDQISNGTLSGEVRKKRRGKAVITL